MNLTDTLKLLQKQQTINRFTIPTLAQNLSIPHPSYTLTKKLSSISAIQTNLNIISSFSRGLAGINHHQNLRNGLVGISQSLSFPERRLNNTIETAINSLSSHYLKEVLKNNIENDIEIVEIASKKIISVSENFNENANQITIQDLDNLKYSIVNEFTELLAKTRDSKTKAFLSNLIVIISFLLTLYTSYLQVNDKSNEEAIIETKRELEKLKRDFSEKIYSDLRRTNLTRIARINVNLRNSAKTNSLIIGCVKSGQLVTVIEIQHKYLLIAYLDKNTGEPKSGFVVKKYFKNTN